MSVGKHQKVEVTYVVEIVAKYHQKNFVENNDLKIRIM